MDAEQEVDLVIAGAGPAGMAAALIGASKASMCSCARSRTRSAAPARPRRGRCGSRAITRARRAGFADSAEAAETYLVALIGETVDRELRAAFLRSRAGGDRLPRRAQRREVPALRQASGLSQQHAGRRACRPRHHAQAVRRTPARRRLQARAPADPRIHAARRHDGRQGRHPAAASAASVARAISSTRRSCSRAISSTGCAIRAARAS